MWMCVTWACTDLGRRLCALSVAVASGVLILIIDTKATQASREECEGVGSRLVTVEAIVSAGRLSLVFGSSECGLSRRMAKGGV